MCGKETVGAATCIETRFLIDGNAYAPVPYPKKPKTAFQPAGRRCPSCNVKPGGFHHVGCTVERCPRCGDVWIFCRCQGWKSPVGQREKRPCKVIPFPG